MSASNKFDNTESIYTTKYELNSYADSNKFSSPYNQDTIYCTDYKDNISCSDYHLSSSYYNSSNVQYCINNNQNDIVQKQWG